MGKPERAASEGESDKIDLKGIYGPVPWLRAKDVKRYPAKVFKSGNSLALRLPAGLGLKAGMEMELRVEDGDYFSFEPAEKPKRKVDVDKFWGTAPGLDPILPEDRAFDGTVRVWDDPDWPGWPEPGK